MSDRASSEKAAESRLSMMETVENLFLRRDGSGSIRIEEELRKLGFVERNADPAAVVLVHPGYELYIELRLNESGKVHAYTLLPFEELDEKQEKFRW